MAPNPEPLDIVANGTLNKRHYHHHHEIRGKQQSQLAAVDHDSDGLDRQLSGSISLVLEAVGFEGADPEALESFSLSVRECECFKVYKDQKAYFSHEPFPQSRQGINDSLKKIASYSA